MAESAAVASGDLATAAQYNNLRNDVLSTTLGHVHDGTNGRAYEDAKDIFVGTGLDAGLRWSTGDASNHSLVLFLGDSNQALHITDKGAVATDWNVGADTHPTLYIHSNTTPATDYLRVGAHDGTTAYLDVVGGTTLAIEVDGTTEVSITASDMDLNSNTLSNVGASGNDWTATSLTIQDSNTGGTIQFKVNNTDNTDTTSHAQIDIRAGGASGGDAKIFMSINGVESYSFGIDNSASDRWAWTAGAALGTNDRMRLASATGVLSVDGAGAGDALPTLFDDYDDAMELRTFQLATVQQSLVSRRQQLANQRHLVAMGVGEWSLQADGSNHWMMRIQPLTKLLAGGVYQNRIRMDQQHDETVARFATVEERIDALKEAQDILRSQIVAMGEVPRR